MAERGPVAAKVVGMRAGVERSRLYVLLGTLKDRGLLVDRGEGYEIADADVWQVAKGS